MKKGAAGTMESNDAYIVVEPCDTRIIEIESIVYDFFQEQIKETIIQTLDELHIENLKVTIKDKGALDYTIKARLVAAIKRLGDQDA